MRLIIRQIRIREGTRKTQRIEVDWSGSGLSALFLMCRTAMIVVVLAALTAAGALGAQVTHAKAHRRPLAGANSRVAATSRVTHRAGGSRLAHRAPAARTRANSAHKLTADEVGQAAGLAIRRQRLGQGQVVRRPAARRTVAQRNGRARFVRASQTARRPRLIATDGIAQPTESAVALPNAISRSTDASIETADTPALPRMPGPALPQMTMDRDNANDGSAAAERLPAAAAEREATSPDEQMDAAAESNPGGTARLPGSPSAEGDGGDQVASLIIPRGAMPAPMRGSLASLERQNTRLDADGLERIVDESDLAERIAHKLLVPVPESSALTVNAELLENHRYCRPWTARFLADLARAHAKAFHRPLEVNSAVRTVEYQKRLMMTNGNAAAAEGDIVSPHLTGATVDIAKQGLTRAELAWMRQRLMELEAVGKIDVEEEFHQACFHITVYKSYIPGLTPQPELPRKPGPASVGGDDAAANEAATRGL